VNRKLLFWQEKQDRLVCTVIRETLQHCFYTPDVHSPTFDVNTECDAINLTQNFLGLKVLQR